MQLTVKDAARMLNVSEKTIYRWIEDNILPTYKINHQYRFSRVELLEWATARRINASSELFTAADADAQPTATLLDALRAGGIHYRVGGTDKESVLRSVVEAMPLSDKVDRDFVVQILMARESLGSTAIGNGIAVPHVRNPIVMRIPHALVSLCFLESPIEFGALDGKPVHTLFTIVSPSIKDHLRLLSHLSHAIMSPAFADAIGRRESRERILACMAEAESLIRPAPGAGGA